AGLALMRHKADEGDILAAMQGAIFAGGGDYPANEFIIGSGEDALLCRYKAGRRKLAKNDQLTLEWAGAYHHYHAAMMRTVLIGKPTKRHEELFEACAAALAACEGEMQVGRSFGDVFDAHARALDAMDLSRHRLNACGYSLGARFSPSWMERQMFYAKNPEPIAPDMVLFAHMILADSETGTAMTLGQTYVTTPEGPRRLSRHAPGLIVR
ncbi:MAG: aminopeptidase P family protein, partial [Phyllobacteriaceae bacterium]|nr:aminopeptidase P family protein [Phyllobacteriaceae bacterium]